MQEIIYRRSAPTRYDHAQKGTQCRVPVDEKTYALYIQRSSNEECPIWEETGPSKIHSLSRSSFDGISKDRSLHPEYVG